MKKFSIGLVIAALAVAGFYLEKEDAPPKKIEAQPERIHSSAPPPLAFQSVAPLTTVSRQAVASERIALSINGRPLDTDGLSVLAFLDKMSPAARRGDPVAAYRVYQAEAMCAQIEPEAKVNAERQGDTAEEKAVEIARLENMRQACIGVTPAQMQERFAFLDQAIRAGNAQAMVDYRFEGPLGNRYADLNPKDPQTAEWIKNANKYAQWLAANGNQWGWIFLSEDYASGDMLPKNPKEAIKYNAAMIASRNPTADPLKLPYVAKLAKGLPSQEVQQAIAEGRALAKQFPQARRG